MNEETRKRMENARHNWRAFSTDDNGVCNEKPDDVFETGYTAAHNDAQGEIEKLKAENTELRKQNDDMNKNCISLLLHESRIRQLQEEKEVAETELSALASRMIYKGNSVSFIYDKMLARGVGINQLLEKLSAERAASAELLNALEFYDETFANFDPENKISRFDMRSAIKVARTAIAAHNARQKERG